MFKKYFKSLDLLKAFEKFPLSASIAILATCCMIAIIDFEDNNILAKTTIAGYLAFLCSISAEIHKNLTKKAWVLILPLIVFATYFLYLPNDFNDVPRYLEHRYVYRLLGSALILHLIISFIPYLKHSSEEDFWEYNKHLFLRIFESGLFSAIIFLGLALAILAVDKLFGIDVDGEWYARLWIFLIGIFNSLYFLSKFPEIDYNGDTEKPAHSYKVFSQYILIGISSIYLVLLYAYAVKILIQGELPQGWIGYLTLCFSVVGILTWLLNFFNPKFSDNRFTLFYKKHFFKFLTIPIIMLFVAIYVRLREYGITENRYIVSTLALWLAFLTLDYGWIKRPHIKVIPISFAVLTAIAVFSGPMDMFSVSLRNQTSRLHDFLIENEILADQKFDLSAVQNMDNTRKFELKDAINSLGDRSDLEMINDWVSDDIFKDFNDDTSYNKASFINKKLGVITAQSSKKNKHEYFNLNATTNQKLNIRGYNSMTPFILSDDDLNTKEYVIKLRGGDSIFLPEYSPVSLREMVLSHQGKFGREIPQSEMTVSFKNQTDSAMLLIKYVNGRIESGDVIIDGGQGWIIESQ